MGTNRYGYSFNDPINKSDPNGHVALADNVVAGALSGAENAALQGLEISFGIRSDFSFGELALDTGIGFATNGIANNLKNAPRIARVSSHVYAVSKVKAKKFAIASYRSLKKGYKAAKSFYGSVRGLFGKGKVKGTNKRGELTSRSTFRKSTHQDAWDSAKPGPNGGKLCPSCDKEVSVPPNIKGKPKDWDTGHNPSWSNRSFNKSDKRQDVVDNYQEGTSLECSGCNRSGQNNDDRFNK